MIVPTPRLLPIALFGIVPVVLSGSYDRALVVAAIWLLLTCALAIADTRLIPTASQLTWERDHEAKLSLGTWNPVTLRFRNRSGRPMELRVRDAVPPALIAADGASGGGRCAASSTWELAYGVLPTHRGDYRFGPIAARYLGPLGLAWRQLSYPLDDTVKVYPNLLAVRAYEALLRRGRLEEMGLHPTRRWGPGTEFERLREYTSDDEYRRINWPATARHHKPIAIDYQTERSQNILIVLDTGRLMSTSIVPTDAEDIHLTRLDYAVNASLLLAFVAQQYGDRVGLLAFADRVSRYLPPRAGRDQFLAITDALYNLAAEPTETDYAAGLGYLAARNPRRSLAIVFTDLAEREAVSPLLAHVSHLARRHLVLVVTLRDPALHALAELPPDRSQHIYERAVASRTLEDREETLRTLRNGGILTLDVAANELSPSVINRYLEIKARTGL